MSLFPTANELMNDKSATVDIMAKNFCVFAPSANLNQTNDHLHLTDSYQSWYAQKS